MMIVLVVDAGAGAGGEMRPLVLVAIINLLRGCYCCEKER